SGALNCLADHRRNALWSVESAFYQGELFNENSALTPLTPMRPAERLEADFNTMRLTTGRHPMAYIRRSLPNDIWLSKDLQYAANGTRLRIAGQAICRQRPGTAKGFVFISLEDEAGIANVIVRPRFFEQHRLVITQEAFLLVEGALQNHSGVIHVQAESIVRLPTLELDTPTSHDFQ
ncbi:MAG: error-prone DNA polymerase, partial [Verrucomicrobia bacterium]|nr:error-prone DNA polymerase [Verrucomicrobiota bacterium]